MATFRTKSKFDCFGVVKKSFHAALQLTMLSRSACNMSLSCDMRMLLIHLVSSEKRSVEELVEQVGRSLIYIKKYGSTS